MYKAKELILKDHRMQFLILAGICGISIALYIFAVNMTVRNVVERGKTEGELSEVVANISELEFEYINLKNSVTLEKAHSLGFEKVDKTKFVSRKTSVAFAHTSDAQ